MLTHREKEVFLQYQFGLSELSRALSRPVAGCAGGSRGGRGASGSAASADFASSCAPSGAVANTMVIAENERTCSMMTVSISSSTGVITISNATPTGSHTISVRASDNCGAFTDTSFQLTVTAQNLFANGYE